MNIENEHEMKQHGENNVWKNIYTKNGALKDISSTQIGQQIIFDEALNALPLMKDWIENKSANTYKNELREYFSNDEFIIEKLAEVFFLLAGSIYGIEDNYSSNKNKVKTRHKKIEVIQNRILPDLKYDLVWRFVEVAVDLSEYFSVEKHTSYVDNMTRVNLYYSCSLSEKILSKLAQDAIQAFYPTPMIVEPIDWAFKDSKLSGGYETYQYDLIRTNSFRVNYHLFDEKIFKAVNKIQSVPWVINEALLIQVREDLIIPKKHDFIKMEFPNAEKCLFDYDLDSESDMFDEKQIEKIKEERVKFSKQLELYNAEAGDFESAMGKYRAVKMAVNIAERYVDKTIYFPHNYDFRGRIYPLPVGLSPQGSDPVKAMIDYKYGEKLSTEGLEWAWAYLATLFGDDKLPFKERISRGKDLLFIDYKKADEPYQFLSHQNEMHKFFNEDDYKFKGRVHLDACNSGSQFTSAITGDIKGCYATNVIPTYFINSKNEITGQARQDAYQLVSDKALELTRTLIKGTSNREEQEILYLFENLLDESGRKICKTPVMVSNYGGTAGGRANILWNMFRELGVERRFITKGNATKFASIIGSSIHGVLNGGKAFEIYIHKMNNVITLDNKAVTWVMHDGFHVTHIKQKELKTKKVTCTLPGARRKTTINKKTFSKDEVSSVKMKSAISPNYIHALDAELLRKVAIRIFKEGVKYSDYIHDSFGCHPNYVSLMLHITKDEFRKMVRRNPLLILDKQLRSQVNPNSKRAVKTLATIERPMMRGFDGRKGELDVVMDSDWFFS